jgi:DNA adenine methylase
MSDLLIQIRRINSLGHTDIAEPFAGGAGASLSLLYREESRDIYINDADPAIHAFWWSLVTRRDDFLSLLSETKISMDEWNRQRDIYRSSKPDSRLRRGFATFYLNRCNRSGIIVNGGPIGGIRQSGKWKLGARFNKGELQRRCEKVASYRERIHVSSKDGINFISQADKTATMFFIDPPYYEKGTLLYLNALTKSYHAKLADFLRSISDAAWILTYDDCPEIRQLYNGWATIRPFSLRYSATSQMRGRELLIAPKWINLPQTQLSKSISW